MKFFQQEGMGLKRTHLHESDHVCVCCEDFGHGAQTYHPDEVECPQCHSLCVCSCHREKEKAA